MSHEQGSIEGADMDTISARDGATRDGRRHCRFVSPVMLTVILVLSVALASRPAAARDGDASGMSLGERVFAGNPRAVVVVDPIAYVGLDTGLALYDVSDATDPLLLSHLYLASPAFDVAVSGTIAYVANGESGLTMIDVSDAATPRVVGNLPTAGTRGVDVLGSIAYLAEASDSPARVFGLRTVDVTDPAAPVMLGFAALPNGALDVVVSGSIAYLGIGSEMSLPDHGLAVVDVSDSSLPQPTGYLGTGLAVNGVSLDGNVACLAAGFPFIGAFITVDVAIPTSPQLMSRTQLADAAMGISIASGIAHVAVRSLGLVTFELADKWAPALLDALPTGRETWAVHARGDVAFVGERSSNGSAGFTAVATLPQPAGLVELASIPFAEAMDVAVTPGVAFLLRRDGLSIFDSSGPGAMELLSTWSPPGADLSVLAAGGSLAVLGEADVIRLVDVADLGSPVERGTITLAGSVVVDMKLSGSTLYVVDGLGLATFDVGDPSRPRAMGSHRSPAWSAAVAVESDRAYLACGSQLQVLDVTFPDTPTLMGSVQVGQPIYGVAARGDLVVVTGLGDALVVVDVSSPSAPRVVGSLTGGPGFDVALLGDRAFVGMGDAGVVVIDVSDPTAPRVDASLDTSGSAVSVAVAGADMLVATVDAQHWSLRCDACAAGCTVVADVQPQDPVICEGTTLLLDASASSAPGCLGALDFQWYEDGTAIPGATDATWLVPASHAPGTFDLTVDVACAALPTCVASASTQVEIVAETWPVVVTDSLRVNKIGGADRVSWQIASGSGDTNIHRSLNVREMTDSAIGPATVVATSPTTFHDNMFSAATGQVIFFKVFGRRSCAGSSVTP
jgi:hypothetical protein